MEENSCIKLKGTNKTYKDIPITDFQENILLKIQKYPNQHVKIVDLAYSLNSNNLAVYSSLQFLIKKRIVISFGGGKDQWDTLSYTLSRHI